MRVVIAGAHGKIARALGRRLVADGHEAVGLVRDPGHLTDLAADGTHGVVCDLEAAETSEVADHLQGADALVFAAGAGPGSGAARKETVDYGAAVRCLSAAQVADVPRYVMVSSMGTDDPPQDDAVFSIYLRAKARADRAVMDSDRQWTIVRPGRLTDDPATGTVTLARHVGRAEVAREDVAAVLVAVLDTPATIGHVLEVVGGDTPIPDALASLTG
jgi:uncharacterized protein YbjT (DUF2867 family)